MEWRHAAEKGVHREAEEPPVRVCEHPDCDRDADHRAPRAPSDLRSWRWFCLDHVRDYNRSWNYFAGWSQHDIERFQHDDVTGHRPTWPFCQGPGGRRREDLEAAFRTFAREWLDGEGAPNGRKQTGTEAISEERLEALALFDLSPPFDLDALKRRYKSLVKRHHPDANGGSRDSEELLKHINHAYNYLKKECS